MRYSFPGDLMMESKMVTGDIHKDVLAYVFIAVLDIPRLLTRVRLLYQAHRKLGVGLSTGAMNSRLYTSPHWDAGRYLYYRSTSM